MTYRTLDPDRIVRTLERLNVRIEERFPGRGIVAVCAELVEIARSDASRSRQLARPSYGIRLGVALIILTAAGLLGLAVTGYFRAPDVDVEAFHVFQGIEALLNITLLTGAGVWFLLNLEARIKRARILSDLHELRAIAHVIDMHQLTKDPTRIAGMDDDGPATRSSPERKMTAFELSRYLDYCAEILSLTGKLAALYIGTSRDPQVIHAVNEIEDLTTSLSRKIWQKIMILRQPPSRLLKEAPATREPQANGQEKEAEGEARLASGHATANQTCSPLHPFALLAGPDLE